MPALLRLSILPLVGIAFLLAGFLWSERELKLRFLGRPVDGQIVGMALQREDHSDLLASLEVELVLTLANGDRLTAAYVNGRLLRSELHPWGSQARPLDGSVSDGKLTSKLRSALDVAASGDATAIRWILEREGRRSEDPLRILQIEKTETVRGWFGLPSLPEAFAIREGRFQLDGEGAEHAGVVRIHAVFDRSDLGVVQANKGETLRDYVYAQNGVARDPEKKNFFLQAEPYATEFRPVFAYESGGESIARLSHIGRHGGPTLALRLFQPCRVYYDPRQPTEAVVTALPGPVAGAPLEWFSRVCEGIFAQWGATALILFAGLMFLVVGLLFVSLAIWPDRKLGLKETHLPLSGPDIDDRSSKNSSPDKPV